MAFIDLEDQNNWIKICEIKNNELCFTKEYLALTKPLGSNARKFAAYLITHWNKSYGFILDYFGPEDADTDWYSGIDGEGMDVDDSLSEDWENQNISGVGLDKEWYRNIMRVKLVTLKLPRILIEEYMKAAK